MSRTSREDFARSTPTPEIRLGVAALARDVALDLGTASTQVYVRGQGLVAEEPSVAAVDRLSREVVDVGRSALDLAEHRRDSVETVWPMRNGVPADAGVTQHLVARLVRPVNGGFRGRMRLVVAVPARTSPLERRVIRDAAKRAGAAEVHLIEHVTAAALGAGLPLHEPAATTVVDVGAGITEVALLSLGSVVASSSVLAGSAGVDLRIKNVLRRDYGMIVSDLTAEEIKLAVSEAGNDQQVMIEASGDAALDGSTLTAILERADVQRIIDDHVAEVIEVVRQTLVQAPPELAHDVIGNGLHLSGGGAQMGGLAKRLSEAFDVPVEVMLEPQRVVVRGAAKCLEATESLHELFVGESA